jgi:hypothetical protein
MITWNALVLFNELLGKAEQQFGPRSRPLKIQVLPRANPVPESTPNGTDGCIVHFFTEAATDHERLRFQLAHEAVHVLCGNFIRTATTLEEGLAVWFSLSVSKPPYRKRAEKGEGVSALFLDALRLFKRLKPSDQKVKELRLVSPTLDDVTPDMLSRVFGAPKDLVQQLCKRVPPDMHLR